MDGRQAQRVADDDLRDGEREVPVDGTPTWSCLACSMQNSRAMRPCAFCRPMPNAISRTIASSSRLRIHIALMIVGWSSTRRISVRHGMMAASQRDAATTLWPDDRM